MKAKANLIKQEAEIEADKEEVKDFLNGIIPDFVKDLGGVISDQVRFWRWINQIKIVKKAKQIIENNNLEKRLISIKVLVPLLESASLEEEKSMQDKWSNLLANAISGLIEIRPNYVEILKELSPVEALVLDKIFEECIEESDFKNGFKKPYSKQKIAEWLKLSQEKADLLIENLIRLNLCRIPGSTAMMFGDSMRVAINTTEIVEFTVTGFDFVRACRTPQNILAK